MSADELKLEVAVMLFEHEKLTLGQASHLAGLPQADFQHVLASRAIGPHYDVAELHEDLETLRRLGRR
jgi:predicted HTH domain antitoxin